MGEMWEFFLLFGICLTLVVYDKTINKDEEGRHSAGMLWQELILFNKIFYFYNHHLYFVCRFSSNAFKFLLTDDCAQPFNVTFKRTLEVVL